VHYYKLLMIHDEVMLVETDHHGECLVVRRSQSGRIQEDRDYFQVRGAQSVCSTMSLGVHHQRRWMTIGSVDEVMMCAWNEL
jgi:hypothetical protein